MSEHPPIAAWRPSASAPAFAPSDIAGAVARIREPLHVVSDKNNRRGVAFGGSIEVERARDDQYALLASLPAIYPEWLGDRSFLETHRVRFPYIAGEMANGIATTRLVVAMARAKMLAFFGAAGLTPARVERAIIELEAELGGTGLPWGANLIHSPAEPAIERAVTELYLAKQVRCVCASAFMDLTPNIVHYALSGLRRAPNGEVARKHRLFAKISRPEVAARFLAPAPVELVEELVRQGRLTRDEAELGRAIPLAEDLTVEADSGGHTDNRPLAALFPTICLVRDEHVRRFGYTRPIRVGAAGGIGTPASVASAFALGASYVLTGSINQACAESGLSSEGKRMLAEADLADVAMAPAADMFELGIKVQVLKRGTMFASRAAKLYELYSSYDRLDAIPKAELERIEREIFRAPIAEIWEHTRAFFEERDRREVELAARDAKHQMALVFRWYLGLSSKWAIDGIPDRRADYQIWCGPAMGAFNRWVNGSVLAAPENRGVVQVALNLLEGAAVLTRAHVLRCTGVEVPTSLFSFKPRLLSYP
jgi:trans-AT polyketide synthase, acyltransferase and oxidoreductase domains